MSSDELSCFRDLLNSATTPEQIAEIERQLEEFVARQAEIDAAVEHGNEALERQNERTALSQEIGPLPPIKDPARRARCKYDLKLAIETYFAAAVFMGLASYQVEMADGFEAVILRKGKKARAVRRGGLKSTLARIATAWGIINGHIKFPVLVGATDDKCNEQRDNFFKMLATSPKLLEDFPELRPLLLKWKNPKKQLRLNGELLSVTSKDERGCIIFPNIPGTELNEARVAAYSILATDVSGLSFVDSTGKTIRPDCLIFDDIQTPQSAKSFMQTSLRENAVTTTFMGLAGLGETMAAIMVCTVREADDLTVRFCDRDRHPDWDGRKFPVLVSEPIAKDLWANYGAKLREGATPDDGLALATAYYAEHREAMDEGGKVAWEEDKEIGYLSALQWVMTKKIIDPSFFRCELQQEGTAPRSNLCRLSADELVKRISGVPRGIAPANSAYLTGFVDSSDEILWWMVVAWLSDFTGWIVDYGTWPDQQAEHFYKSSLRVTVSEQMPKASWEEAFAHAHNTVDAILLRDWQDENGKPRTLDLMLKDWSDGDHKKRIEPQVMASAHRSRIRPSKGFAPKPGRKPVHAYGVDKDRHTRSHWVERRSETPVHIQFDSNVFKTHVARRLQTIVGAPSCLLLPGSNETENLLLAEHLTSEQAKSLVYDGTPGSVWEVIPGRDNDWWDTLVGNAVAASVLGCMIPGEAPAKPKPRQRKGPITAQYF